MKHFVLTALASLLLFPLVSAQGAPFSLLETLPAEEQDTSSQVTHDNKSIAPTPLAADSLASDTRLNTRVSLSSGKTTMAEAVAKLHAMTKLPLAIDGRQAQDYSIAFYLKEVRLADVLDGLASVRDFTWEEQTAGRIVLTEPYNPRIWDVWPNNLTSEDQQIYGLGKQFLLLYRQLPLSLQTQLCNAKQSMQLGAPLQLGAPFYDLPAPMQANIRAMARLSIQSEDKNPVTKGLRTIYPGYGPETRIVFYKPPQELAEGVPGYAMSVIGKEGGSVGMGFFDFTGWIITFNSPPILLDHTKEDSLSRQEAVTKDTRLQQKYTFEAHSATISEALLQLSAQTHIDFVAEFWHFNWGMQSDDEQRSLLLREATLKDILDRLASEYHASWSWRPSGVYVWHPAFKPYPNFKPHPSH